MDRDRLEFMAAALLGMLRVQYAGETRPDEERTANFLEQVALEAERGALLVPVPMLLHCPMCGDRHLDVGAFATKVHHTHACQGCGHCWRPAVVPTVGVQFLPGFKNEEKADA